MNSSVSVTVDKKINLAYQSLRKNLKQNKKSAIVLTTTTHPFPEEVKIFPLRYIENFVCLPLGVKNHKSALRIVKKFDGKVDAFFIDIENKLNDCYDLFSIIKKNMTKSKLYPIKGNDFSADATFAIIHSILSGISGKKFCIFGAGNIGSKLALKLVESGAKTYIINSSKSSTRKVTKAINALKPAECPDKVKGILKTSLPQNLDCIIGFTRGVPVINKRTILNLKQQGCVIDGGLGTISSSGLEEARKRKIKILKIDIRVGFLANAILTLYTEKFLSEVYGFRKIDNFKIVAGGFLGEKGDIVVDKISKPSKIIGIADGVGGIINTKHYKKNVNKTKNFLKI